LGSLLVLLVFILRTGPTLIYDEPFHMETVHRLEHQGFTAEYLRGASQSSPGPLYAVVHTALRPLTAWQAPAIRLVNFAFLLITMALVWTALRLRGSSRALAAALSLLAAPTMWVISGMALTEMPAMTFAMAGTVCLMLLPRLTEEQGSKPWFVAALGGVAAGLAVTGRQPYLAVFCAAPALVDRRTWKLVALFLAAGAVLPGMLFSVWGGISPPQLTDITKGISPTHGVLALAYGGAMVAIVTLRWFGLGWKINTGAAVIAMAANLAFGFLEITPARSLAERCLSGTVLPIYSRFAAGILLALAVLFVLSTLKNIVDRRRDRTFLFACLCGGLICLTAMKVTVQFSSRYVATAMPWLLLSAEQYWEPGGWKTARALMGAALGLMTLASYFTAHS
jgi:4-amino-4-deoxy-L-arabinose transferase-like glycosyltransferase